MYNMKTRFIAAACAALAMTALQAEAAPKQATQGYPINGVPFTAVKVSTDSFWGDRIRQSRDVTIPLAFSKCEETDRYTNFEHAAAKMAETARGDNSSNYRRLF